MNILKSKKLRFLLLIPLLFLICDAVYWRYATKEIDDSHLREKYVEIVNFVDMLTITVNADVARGRSGYGDGIRDATEFIDNLHQVFAAAYRLEPDGNLLLLTSRTYETSIFEPLDYPSFCEKIQTGDSGEITIGYTPENQAYRELHLYFRWMPTVINAAEKYLVVAGISEHSVTSHMALWVSIGQWVSTIIVFSLIVWLVVMLADCYGHLSKLIDGHDNGEVRQIRRR